MKISRIEYENFRNFKEHGCIKCSTDGKVTIVYGKNGDGKTTLHQLFQWILYNGVSFNQTTSNSKLYNMEREQEVAYLDAFDVFGSIDFIHNDDSYSLRRIWRYKRELDSSRKIGEEVTLSKKDDDDNWNRLNNPKEIIEELLPSGLSDYFFFDGESMIADLRRKGKDSATSLRKALYSIFGMDILEEAKFHIGDRNSKTTVIGKLYLDKGSGGASNEVARIKTTLEQAQNKKEEITDDINSLEKQEKEFLDKIKIISEKIGNTKSKADYEKKREELKSDRDSYLYMINEQKKGFGQEIIETYPRMLLSKTIERAKVTLKSKADATKDMSIQGIRPELINSILQSSHCICGNEIEEKERAQFKEWLQLLPPNNYDKMYNDFCKSANRLGKKFDQSLIENHIKQLLKYKDSALEKDRAIKELDEEEKATKDCEELINDRIAAEEKVEELKKVLQEKKIYSAKIDLLIKKTSKDYDKATEEYAESKDAERKIKIMEEVRLHFEDQLLELSKEYSEKLGQEIQNLLNKMLTSTRKVTVSEDFYLSVYDSYRDESKSEGQFAIVTFAYIGGILKMLKEIDSLNEKEYPLVLDGPFSKLDVDQRQNVINTIPAYAPQVIIFSKDDLQNYFSDEQIGYIWTIKSNLEKNVATVEEGFLWK